MRIEPSVISQAERRLQDAACGDRQVLGPDQRRLPRWLLYAGILALMVLPANLLVLLGIPYNLPGGSPFIKIHPSSYLILLAFLACLAQRSFQSSLGEVAQQKPMVWIYPLIASLVTVITVLRFGISGVAFYIDGLIVPGALAWLLLAESEIFRRRTFHLIVVVILLNAVLGILEAASGWRLLPYLIAGEAHREEFFRSAALASHPLESAGRTVPVLLASLVMPSKVSLILIPILLLGLLGFGSRSAFIIVLVCLLMIYQRDLMASIRSRTISVEKTMGSLLLGLLIFLVSLMMIFSLDLGTRIIETLYWDQSASARIESVLMLRHLSLEEWWFGSGPEGVKNLTQLRMGWFNFENFWVILLIQLGVIQLILFTLAFLFWMANLVQEAAFNIRLAALAFLIIASGSDILATKTTNLSILVVTVIGAMAYSEKRGEPHPKITRRLDSLRVRSALRSGSTLNRP